MGTATGTLEQQSVLLVGTAGWVEPLAAELEEGRDASVRTASTVQEAIDAEPARRMDCVVTDHGLADGTGIDLLRALRERTASLPVVVCTDAGSEAIASEAVGAGATDYVALPGSSTPCGEVADRLERAVRGARRTETRRDRARQFDAVFRNTGTATWVLDPSGRLERANETARELIDSDIASVVGDRFWALPWWARTERTRSDIRDVVETVVDRHSTERVVTRVGEDGAVIELSLLPVEDPYGTLVGIIVEGDDVTERVSLYRELRASERLHRVTLNNMTDTVLVTDDDGAFTYVCPNVHFIFGYSVEEIRKLGTIDELLGEGLFDREELAEAGVLTNVECTTTDKAGEEHTLLVNVREVDIQGGTLLFSCRDVTERKRREEALGALQRTTRSLLYAETRGEIARLLVDDVAEILDLPASAIYLFDTDENALRPGAATDRFEDLHGPLSPVEAGGETLVGQSFIEDEPAFHDDVRDVEQVENRATGLRSGAYVPLGGHGVLAAGSATPGGFDTLRRELADLVAATAEAALDRVERESRLRRQDRTLQRQNRRLTQLNDVNELIRDIDRALVQAQTREEVDRTVCAALTKGTHFSFAWIGERDGATGELRPEAWAGGDQGYLDRVDLAVDPPGGEPASRTAVTRETTVVDDVAGALRRDGWRKEALAAGHQSAIAVPLAYDDFTYGVLAVYADAPDAFDDMVREVLTELGETVASAVSGLNRKNALLTSTGTRIELETADPGFVLTQLARRADCSITFAGGVHPRAGGSAIFVSVDGADVEDVVATAREMVAVEDVRHIHGGETDGLLQLGLDGPFIAGRLADHGAVVDRIEADGDAATLTVDVPSNIDSRPIVRHVEDTLADTELLAKYAEDLAPSRDLYAAFLERVTDRQLEVVRAAYYGGYFESPREQTGEDVADALGISPPAFYRHARTVQRKLFSTLFEDVGVRAPEPG